MYRFYLQPFKRLCFQNKSFFGLETETSSVLEKLNETILNAEGPILKNNQASNEDIKKQPKWMRFFLSADPPKIDLERSIRNENQDTINNYIKMNYQTFDINQLIIIAEKTNKYDMVKKILTEIKIKIVLNKINLNEKMAFSLLYNNWEHIKKDETISNFLFEELYNNFDKLKINEKNYCIIFFFETNKVDFEVLEKFLDETYLENDEVFVKSRKYFEELTNEELNIFLSFLNVMYTYLTKKNFDKYFPKKKIEILFENIVKKWSLDQGIINEAMFQITIDKLIPNKIPKYFSIEQQIVLKKLINSIFFEKLNTEENFGRYNFNFFERSMILSMINSIFCESDRYLIKETISLLSQLLSKDWQWKENRSEWKLLQTFSRMSLINKFSLNENSLSLPSLIRTLATSVRKDYGEADFSTFMNFSFETIKSFFDLNYQDFMIISEGNEFLKSNWDQANKNLFQFLIECLKNISSFRSIKTLDDILNNNLNEILENDDKIDEKFLNESFANKIDSLDINQYGRQLKIRKEETNNYIQSKNIKTVSFYNNKIPVNIIFITKLYINLVDLIKSTFLFMDENNMSIIPKIKAFFEIPTIESLFKNIIFYPNLLENCLIINNQNPDILPESFKTFILDIKKKIDTYFEKTNGDTALLIKTINEDLKNMGISQFERDSLYQDNIIDNNKEIYFFSKNIRKQAESNLNDPIFKEKFKFQIEEDFFFEKFANTPLNFYKKILNSQIMYYMVNESMLKQLAEKSLLKSGIPIKKNVCDFPFYADFIVDYNFKSKVIMIEDHFKLLLGAENVKKIYFKQAKLHYEKLKYGVFFIKYENYDIDERVFLDSMKTIIK